MPVGLKIDIFTREGLHETLPALLDLLSEYKLEATFFPALGPDPTRTSGLVGRLLDKTPDLDIETDVTRRHDDHRVLVNWVCSQRILNRATVNNDAGTRRVDRCRKV